MIAQAALSTLRESVGAVFFTRLPPMGCEFLLRMKLWGSCATGPRFDGVSAERLPHLPRGCNFPLPRQSYLRPLRVRG